MKRTARWLPIFFLLLMAAPPSAGAYWIQHANNALDPAVSPEQFRPDKDGLRPAPGRPPSPVKVEVLNLPPGQAAAAFKVILSSALTWDAIPGSAMRVSAEYQPDDSGWMPRYSARDGRNTLEFIEEGWPSFWGPNVIAMTVPHLGGDGDIIEADIFCNARDFRWVVLETDGVYPALAAQNHVDVGAIVTHEFGHLLGLGHSELPYATMYQFVGLADTRARRLGEDDRRAIRALYPLTAEDASAPSLWGAKRDSFADPCGMVSSASTAISAWSVYIGLSGGTLSLASPPLAGDTAVTYCIFGSGFAGRSIAAMGADDDGALAAPSRDAELVGVNFVRAVLMTGSDGLPALAAGSYDLFAAVDPGRKGYLDSGLMVNPPGNSRPQALIQPAREIFTAGETARLDGSLSSDPDGDPVSFEWKIVEKPARSRAALSANGAPATRLQTDYPGVYAVRLVVNDGIVDSVADLVLLRALPDTGGDDSGYSPTGCAAATARPPAGYLLLLAPALMMALARLSIRRSRA